MVGLVSALVGEIAYEVVRFVIMLALLVLAVFVGGKLRKAADAKKAAKMAAKTKGKHFTGLEIQEEGKHNQAFVESE